MFVITLQNQKGGSGKTTVAVSVASCLAEREKRVCLIDADYGQESAMTWGDINGNKYFEMVAMKASQIEAFIARNEDRFDYIIIDTPPRADRDAGIFVRNSHLVLIVAQPSPYDIWACDNLLEVVNSRREATKGIRGLPADGLPHARILFSRAIRGTRIIKETTDAVAETGLPIMRGMTTEYDIYKRSAQDGKTIFDHAERNDKACKQVNEICDEIEEVLCEPIAA